MKQEEETQPMHKSTKAIYAGSLNPPIYGEVSVPISRSATFSFPSAEEGASRFSGEKPGYIYTRLNNLTINALEENVTALENGLAGMATATGMATVTTVYLALLGHDAHILATDSL
jgi:O-acetylhomoserine/O-acetylserine sulfhydrylase-like pyridoxal-dependent enzyme